MIWPLSVQDFELGLRDWLLLLLHSTHNNQPKKYVMRIICESTSSSSTDASFALSFCGNFLRCGFFGDSTAKSFSAHLLKSRSCAAWKAAQAAAKLKLEHTTIAPQERYTHTHTPKSGLSLLNLLLPIWLIFAALWTWFLSQPNKNKMYIKICSSRNHNTLDFSALWFYCIKALLGWAQSGMLASCVKRNAKESCLVLG